MNDLEKDVRELLEARARNAAPTQAAAPSVFKRARRRQAATAFGAILGVAAILAGSILGVRALVSSDSGHRPAVVPGLPHASEGFRGVVLPYASLAYPEDWSLVADDPARTANRVLQLTNFGSGPGWINCEAGFTLPRGGVMLEVQLGAGQEQLPEWPTSFEVVPGDAKPCGADGLLGASWTASGTAFSATGLMAPDAAQEDVDLMEQAFESLAFPEAAPQTEEFIGSWNLILDSADSPVGPVLLYAYADLEEVVRERPSYWIGIAGPIGSGLSGAGSIGGDVPVADEGVTMYLDTWGGVVWGDVSSEAVRAELRTVEGLTFPADLLPLAQSVGLPSHQAVWGIVQGATADRVTTLLYDGQGKALNTYFPAGSRVPIAAGTDPEGGPWRLYLEPTNEGTGLGFGFTGFGGGGGCCLQPLKGEFQLDGWGSGSDEPSDITALASEAVTRLEFEAATGERIEGGLYAVPDASLGIPQIGLVIVPSDVALEGQLVAYDASGDELAREDVGDTPEPAGPTTEIDIVWDRLRRARDVVQEYEARHHGSLSGFDATEARKIDPGIGGDPGIRWNDGPLANGDVSIRGVARAGGSELTGLSGWNVVLVSATVGPQGSVGSIYCIAVNIDENGGGNFRYGTQDAASYEECRGGWPELGG
jgi:hypothetical protein